MTALAPYRPAINTTSRLIDVARLGLDRETERGYLRDIVEAVVDRLDTPFVIIDVLLNDAQIFLAGHGPVPEFITEAGGTPVEWAFCQPLVTERRPRRVADLAADPLFRDNPLVTVGGVRSYAGAPLISHTGFVLGGICGLDVKPREFALTDAGFLQLMAIETVNRLEAYADG